MPTNGDLVCGEWPNLWPSMLGRSEALDAAIYGYCAAFLGSTTKDRSLMHQSQALYGRGIRYLLNTTRQAARIKDEAVLVAVLLSKIDVSCTPPNAWEAVIDMLQMFNPMSGMGWASHMLGSIELLRLRGPPTEGKTMNAGLWQLLRFTAIATAISSRKSLFLALPGWNGIHLPGTTHPLVNELLDIAVHLPGLLEEFDWLVNFVPQSLCLPYPNSPAKYGMHLRRKCSWVGIKLQQWYTKLQGTIIGPLFWPDVADVTLKAPFNTSLNFPTLHIGQLHLFYWAYQIILQKTAIALRQLAKDSLRISHTLSNAEHEAVGDYCASQICCSLPFFLRKDIGGVAAQALMWPLAVAMRFYSDRITVDAAARQRNSWCDETSESLSEQGYSLCKNFLLLEKRNYSDTSGLGPYIKHHL